MSRENKLSNQREIDRANRKKVYSNRKKFDKQALMKDFFEMDNEEDEYSPEKFPQPHGGSQHQHGGHGTRKHKDNSGDKDYDDGFGLHKKNSSEMDAGDDFEKPRVLVLEQRKLS